MICKTQAIYSAMVSMPRLCNTPSPLSAITQIIRASTPKGATSITIMVTFIMTSAASSNQRPMPLPISPAIRMPIPNMIAKKITARISPLASAAIGFSGTMFSRRSTIPPAASAAACLLSTVLISAPAKVSADRLAPGLKRVPIISPSVTATAVVPIYITSVLAPREPRRFGSPIAMTPETSVVKMSGTISILIRRRNKSPSHFTQTVANSPPASAPMP